jgi:hypothetical protein
MNEDKPAAPYTASWETLVSCQLSDITAIDHRSEVAAEGAIRRCASPNAHSY